jgi:spermidine/putrescine transport system substrate-binding protein
VDAARPPRGEAGDARRASVSIERSAPTISRRALLRGFGGALALTVVGACDREPAAGPAVTGSPTPAATPSPDAPAVDWDAWWAEQELTGTLDFANWPYYIDRRRDNSHPSLDRFTETQGVAVNYYRPIRENARFLDRIRPSLQAGEPIGYDLIVISNGPELSELIGSGWVVPLDHSRLPNFERFAGPLVRGPIWDPENRFSIAWQSGLTGIAYAPEAVELLGHEPRSVEDLWNPALRGRVGMLSDLVELGSLGLLAAGIAPSVSTPDNWRTAATILEDQKGAVDPRYYDQGYVDALGRRDILIALAYSGDIFQLNNLGDPDLRFVVPAEGAMLWTDNLLIPANAAHPLDALTYMNFVYRPQIAAMIANWVWYICPVPAAKPIVASDLGNPAVARSPLVFPGAELIGDAVEGTGAGTELLGSRVHDYYVYADAQDYDAWTAVFEPIVYG